MNEFRVIVTGSRKWPSQDLVWEALGMVCCERLPDGGTLTVVHGACPTGADYFAHTWFDLPTEPEYVTVEEPHPADWDACSVDCAHAPHRNRSGRMYCPVAGHRRNRHMVWLGADLVLAFPLPGPRTRSRGTWDCVKRAQAAGIPVEVQSLDFQPRFTFDQVAEALGAVDEAVGEL